MGECNQSSTGAETSLSVVSGKGRYSQFQRTMLQWSSLHPYNAVHVIQVAGTINPLRFEDGINHVLETCGLGYLSIDLNRGIFRFLTGNPHCAAIILAEGTEDSQDALSLEMQRQLNESFAFDRTFTPFRFFILSSGGETFLGISYFHAVADAESITRLLLEIVRACFDETPSPVRDKSLRPSGDSIIRFGSPLAAIGQTWAAIARIKKMRSSVRPSRSEITDFHNEFSRHSLDHEQSSALLSTAREWGITVNDLCLAALLIALAPLATDRFLGKRPNLSVGCVVNLRNDPGLKTGDYFGLFLGSFTVTHPVQDGITLKELATNVREQTLEIKSRRRYLAAPLEFMASRFIFARLPLEKQCNFYRKSYPLWGSITNMKMDRICKELDGVPIKDYYRAVSAGPAMPLVIALTGINGHLNFGVSHRPTVIPTNEVDGVMKKFMKHMTTLSEQT